MAEYTISSANLNAIERGLSSIVSGLGELGDGLGVVDTHVEQVRDNVKIVYDQIGALAQEFRDFVNMQIRANELSSSQQNMIHLKQELEEKFGHYDIVRRTTTGILQADDLGIIRKETITTATEELMVSSPRYWLAPCLVALSAWISDQPELAEKAVREAIHRNRKKTYLFWSLVCRRANRTNAALRWMECYFRLQEETNLERETIVILDAFAGGLFGADTEGVVSRQMEEWMDRLSTQDGFTERQKQQWTDAINLKRKPYTTDAYPYLRKYSKTWPVLERILEGAHLHAEVLEYFTGIFEQEASTEAVKVQLDDILTSLVSEYDDEELPLRKEYRYHQFVVEFGGDTDRARRHMELEQSAFEERKDFTQLLADAAMKPESSHASVSTQKFAIALSRDWISDAYNDITVQNRALIPDEIEINVDTFNGKTRDGENEEELVRDFEALVDSEKAKILAQCVLSGFEKFCLWGGIAIGVIGLIMLFGSPLLGLIAIVASVGMIINYFSKKKKADTNKKNIIAQFEEKRTKGIQIIRATLAEVVDFRAEYKAKDAESQQVVDFLDQLSPEQYVRQLSASERRIKVSK